VNTNQETGVEEVEDAEVVGGLEPEPTGDEVETGETGERITEHYSIPVAWINVMGGSEINHFDDLLSECDILDMNVTAGQPFEVTVTGDREVITKLRTQVALWASKFGEAG
jgi:hypothetical protein